ncbi:hypothetical protein [Stappia sp. TSB10GB4]|uniref:hypothetical protein n=1 Tax=Stappia sp. TSB10GB4 TaxID=2003584 RepID=UPI001647FA9D|nr:hypothetical protein [Stappia sp. TSB10GB4]
MLAIQILVSTVPVLVGAGGFYLAFLKWQSDQEDRRVKELRREEVFVWVNECIDCLRSLIILTEQRDSALFEGVIDVKRRDLIIRTSTLIERGRLFFPNNEAGSWGLQKSGAYRGFRPVILDQLVMAHQLALIWPESRKKSTTLAAICAENFVTLAQKEVGRSQSISAEPAHDGDSVYLSKFINCPENFRIQ